jgi:hypothetical protein
MCADNGMSDQSYLDLNEMMRVGSTPDVNIVVQVDRPAWDTLPLPLRYRVLRNGLERLGELEELDMADPASLADFVRFGTRFYPADNYLLVLWDHGNGWTTLHAAHPSPIERYRGIFYDASSGNEMSVAGGQLKQAMDSVRSILGRKVAILAFDACLMQMLEVAYEVRNDAGIMVSTEDLMPWGGFPYDTFFSLLTRYPQFSPRAYAGVLPGVFVSSYSDGSQGNEPVTLSSVDLAILDEAVKSLSRFLTAVSVQAPTAAMRSIRNAVQTFASEHVPATSRDDNIDVIHLLELSHNLAPERADEAAGYFRRAVIAVAANDPSFEHAGGLAAWFPDNYPTFKLRHSLYHQLEFSEDCPWLHFLNCYFAADDVKPFPVELTASPSGGRNDIRLVWSRSADLSPVSYELRELSGIGLAFDDPADDLARWNGDGFTLRDFQGRSCFFSGTGSNLDNRLTVKEPLALPGGGLLEFQAYCDTRETQDTLGHFLRDVAYLEWSPGAVSWALLDSFYGTSQTWLKPRCFLPASDRCWLRFRFATGTGPHVNGIYLDSIRVESVSGMRTIRSGCRDTFLDIFNPSHGDCSYAVVPRDSFGNLGYVSNLAAVSVVEYAAPYSIPAPITGTQTTLVCDFPANDTPAVRIYSLSGELIRKDFPADEIAAGRITWNCDNGRGQTVASGIYLVVVQGRGFLKRGCIAVVR